MRFVFLFFVFISLSGCMKSNEEIAKEYEGKKKAAEASAVMAAQEAKIKKIKELEAVLVKSFKDPDSVKFKDLSLNSSGDGLCGYVNAKNSYGAYVGFTEFVYDVDGVRVRPDGCTDDQDVGQDACYIYKKVKTQIGC